MYCKECGFFRSITKYLKNYNGKFEDNIFKTLIKLIYSGLNKKVLNSYNKVLFRCDKILKKEYEENFKCFEENEEIKIVRRKPIFCAKSFMSFSKKEEKVDGNYYHKSYNNENCYSVKYIIEESQNNDFFVTNVEVEKISENEDEEEVLILPNSCFEVVKVEIDGDKGKIIHLKYLSDERLKSYIIQSINKEN